MNATHSLTRVASQFRPRVELLEDRQPPSDLLGDLLLGLALWNPQADRPAPDLGIERNADPAARPAALVLPAAELQLLTPSPGGAVQGPQPGLEVRQVPQDEMLAGAVNAFPLKFDEGGGTVQGPSFDIAPAVPANNREICTNGRGRLQNETAIAVHANIVVVAYNDSRGWPGNGCPTQAPGYQISGWAYSLDYGATFTDGGPLPVTNRVNVQGDPWLAVGPNGEIYLANLWNGVSGLAVLSGTITEKGVVWNPDPAVLTGATGGPTWDKEAIAVDPATGYVYLTYTRFGGVGGITLYRSFDGGASFEGPIPIATGSTRQASQAVVGPSGEIHVMWTERTGAASTGIGYSVSYDYGTTWAAPRIIAPQRNVAVLGADRASPFGHMVLDHTGGEYGGSLYVTYHSSHVSGSHNDVFLVHSRDGGQTWSQPLMVNDDGTTTQQWWPTVSVDDAGFVNMFYYDRRAFPANSRETELYFAQSRDGGQSFLPSFPVSDFPTTWGNYSEGGFTVTGDYTRAVSYGLDNFVAYVDHRDVDPDVYVTRISTLA